ncbi:MAG: hypothetical protein M1818_007776 [Claussenomyces sp. TS43310]|nr:MAG: hypothetical protein M1818_007776 [Claussenomyces sp. TS43310]
MVKFRPRAPDKSDDNLHIFWMDDTEAALHNLLSLQKNGHVYADHHVIGRILVKSRDGSWAASSRFPNTVGDFVKLNETRREEKTRRDDEELTAITAEDMGILRTFYGIKKEPEKGSVVNPEITSFKDIALAFGLSFWLP